MTRNTGQKGVNLMPMLKDREKAMTDITQYHCDVFVVVFKHVQYIKPEILLLILNKYLPP